MSGAKQLPERRFAFTKRKLERLPIPTSGRAEYHDARAAGLTLRITPQGKRTFCFFRRVNGELVRMTLGEFPAMTVEQARGAATAAQGEFHKGNDPREAKRRARTCPTIAKLFDFYLENHAKAHKRERSWKEDQAQYDRYVKGRWASRKATSIRKGDVAALHAKIGRDHGIYAANRLRSLLHKMFAVGLEADLFKGPNPVAGVKKFKEETRDRFLDADELKRFFKALAAEPHEVIRDYLLLSLLVGARRSNMLAMRWADVSLDRGVWRIPETKSGEPQVVPLSDAALTVLRNRRAATPEDCDWVFPTTGNHPSKAGHLTDPTVIWKGVLERAKLEGVRLHDLRRTLASWQALTGSTELIIAKTLGHAEGSRATAVYSRLTTAPVRESVQKATAAMLEHAGGLLPKPAGNGQGENGEAE